MMKTLDDSMARLAAAAWLLLVCVSTTHAGGLQFPLTSGNELWSSIVGKRTDKSGCNGCQLSNMGVSSLVVRMLACD
ncbi:hypothetical protein C0Q70_08354 [Pomacea canaliculata]|uniref:Uncharacterized protein n=1 Tax=Pomacea canaliculata TaxID=400727 RepID=A0A2T7PHM3_POMCA|nr:hypothetical protein C0Q70_08354 [Pomacea canaliculata]